MTDTDNYLIIYFYYVGIMYMESEELKAET